MTAAARSPRDAHASLGMHGAHPILGGFPTPQEPPRRAPPGRLCCVGYAKCQWCEGLDPSCACSCHADPVPVDAVRLPARIPRSVRRAHDRATTPTVEAP